MTNCSAAWAWVHSTAQDSGRMRSFPIGPAVTNCSAAWAWVHTPKYSSRQWQDEKLSHWYRSVDIKAKFQNNFLLYGSLYVKKKNNLPIFQNCPETFILKFANLFFEKYAKFNFNILANCHKKMIVTKFCETLTTKVKVKNLCFQNLSFVSKPNEYRPENPMLTWAMESSDTLCCRQGTQS